MKRMLILGDSISMGYREFVRESLHGKAEVLFSEENGRFVKYTHWLSNQWIRANGAPDIIHWNNGIWDITREPPVEGCFTPLDEYIHGLARTLSTFRAAGVPAIVFATTTYPHPGREEQRAEDIDEYNAAARALMEREGVPVNDLGALIKNRMEYVCEDHLHLTEAGYRACAAMVVEKLTPYLMSAER